MSTFRRLHPRLQRAIVSRLGWTELRPVQELAGQAILDGSNAVVLAPTAGGKTEAALFPLLSSLLYDPPRGVGLLYIAPIKALLNNQSDRLDLYTEMVGLRRFVWHGDVTPWERHRFRMEPVDLLLTTPESLEVMLVSEATDAAALFGDLRAVVIDEIHALAGTDRGAHLASVLQRIVALSRHDVQRIGLSATVGNPAAILGWLGAGSRRPGIVIDPPRSPAARELLVLLRDAPLDIGEDAAAMGRGKKSLVFCQSRATSEAVAGAMKNRDIDVFVHHSSVSREERQEAEARFHGGGPASIVCTSTLELGIDVGDLDRVFQVDAPSTVGAFLQRMGRTGRRAGAVANMTFFCTSPWTVLQAMALVRLARKGWVEDVAIHTRCWPVLVHQLLAMALGGDGRGRAGIPPEKAFELLRAVPDLSGFSEREGRELVRHLLTEGYLEQVGGLLVVGEKGERTFGRRNFMALYAVFESPQMWRVLAAGGREVGSVEQSFVDRLVEDVSTFSLSGRAWVVRRVNHEDRLVEVTPAPRGRQPSWGGFLPQFLGREICEEIRLILRDPEVPAWVHESARPGIAELRERFARVVEPHHSGLEVIDGEVRWWTFAGGRINTTLRHALTATSGAWRISADNFCVTVRAPDIRRDDVVRALGALGRLLEAGGDDFWRDVYAGLPNYRLSKFQALLPEPAVREMLGEALLDVEGATEFARRALAVPYMDRVVDDWGPGSAVVQVAGVIGGRKFPGERVAASDLMEVCRDLEPAAVRSALMYLASERVGALEIVFTLHQEGGSVEVSPERARELLSGRSPLLDDLEVTFRPGWAQPRGVDQWA